MSTQPSITETLEQLKQKFHALWLRGSGWRLELGEVLYKIKIKCEYGEWGAFLKEYDLKRASADKYVRDYCDKAELALPRQFEEPNPAPAPDPQADERLKQLAAEKAKREGKKPTPHASELHVRVKKLRPDQLSLYRDERLENRARVDDIWRAAFMYIIGVEQMFPPLDLATPAEAASYTATDEDVPDFTKQEAEPCSAS